MISPLELEVEKSKVESCRPPTRCGSGRGHRPRVTSGSAKGELARRSRQDVSFSTRRCSRRASREGARHADSPPRARSLIDLGESGCQAPPREAPFSNVARAFVCRNQSQKQPHSHTPDARPINASEIYPFISKMLLRSMWGSERQLSNWHQPGPRAANTNPNCELRIDRRPRPQPLPAAGCHPSHSDLHVGARHRRRCVDLVLRFDFDGAWHRPARIRCAPGRHARPSRPFKIRVGGGSLFFVLRFDPARARSR